MCFKRIPTDLNEEFHAGQATSNTEVTPTHFNEPEASADELQEKSSLVKHRRRATEEWVHSQFLLNEETDSDISSADTSEIEANFAALIEEHEADMAALEANPFNMFPPAGPLPRSDVALEPVIAERNDQGVVDPDPIAVGNSRTSDNNLTHTISTPELRQNDLEDFLDIWEDAWESGRAQGVPRGYASDAETLVGSIDDEEVEIIRIGNGRPRGKIIQAWARLGGRRKSFA